MGSQPLQGDERSAKFAVASEQQETFAHASCAQRAMISNSACYIMACSLTYLQRRCGVRRFRPAGGTVCGVVACGLCLCLVGHDDDARPAPARRPSHLAVFPPRHHIFLILDHSRRSVRMMMYRLPRSPIRVRTRFQSVSIVSKTTPRRFQRYARLLSTSGDKVVSRLS
jgi:hypothetical protein